jgi:lipopolysaccharide transport system ATP-binding protein
MKSAIRVERLSKQYRIGARETGYRTLRESLGHAFASPWRRWRSRPRAGRTSGPRHEAPDTFWALKDVSFDVQPGEVVGVIGRNGAGKSTLLKLLSRITEPSSGRVELRGRVGSLLEVGTGFHPELTGRENIFLNGSILGMTRREIARKFDEIVAFAEVERFLDTPVKRYSSGMYVRLAFAVAAHLELEILLVDEVLAVGDMAFQKKCLGKMQGISQSGRTVLFVSHNMGVMQNLCDRGLVLEAGQVKFQGDLSSGIAKYEAALASLAGQDLARLTNRGGTGEARVTAISLEDAEGFNVGRVSMGEPTTIRLRIRCNRKLHRPKIGIAVTTPAGQRLFRLLTSDQGVQLPDLVGEATVECLIPRMPLLPGLYLLTVGLHEGMHTIIDQVEGAVSFEVIAADVFGTGAIPQGRGDLVFVPSQWHLSS